MAVKIPLNRVLIQRDFLFIVYIAFLFLSICDVICQKSRFCKIGIKTLKLENQRELFRAGGLCSARSSPVPTGSI